MATSNAEILAQLEKLAEDVALSGDDRACIRTILAAFKRLVKIEEAAKKLSRAVELLQRFEKFYGKPTPTLRDDVHDFLAERGGRGMKDCPWCHIDPNEIAALKQRVAELERELAAARGVTQADDARLRAAERRVYDDPDLTFGCDAADHMADMVLELRQHNAELERELEAARNVCEAAGVVIDDTRNASYADCCVNKGKVCDLLAALAAYRATQEPTNG